MYRLKDFCLILLTGCRRLGTSDPVDNKLIDGVANVSFGSVI